MSTDRERESERARERRARDPEREREREAPENEREIDREADSDVTPGERGRDCGTDRVRMPSTRDTERER